MTDMLRQIDGQLKSLAQKAESLSTQIAILQEQLALTESAARAGAMYREEFSRVSAFLSPTVCALVKPCADEPGEPEGPVARDIILKIASKLPKEFSPQTAFEVATQAGYVTTKSAIQSALIRHTDVVERVSLGLYRIVKS